MGSGEPLAFAPASDWWPYRNQLLATLAAPTALRHGCGELLFGTVSSDSSHVDGTQEFYARLSALMELQEGGLVVRAPAAQLQTAELVRKSNIPREVLGWAHSCHVSNLACGHCRGCVKHFEVSADVYGEAY
jgi:7-cyano-7-deazaguanine synthase